MEGQTTRDPILIEDHITDKEMKMLEVLPLQVILYQTGQVLFAFPKRVINDWEKSRVNYLAMVHEIPVKYFLKKWKLITQDICVLSVHKEGYKLEFIQKRNL